MAENNGVDYRDDTPLSQSDVDDVNRLVEQDQYSNAGNKIANWLKTKLYGKPTRGAMSLWASIIGDSTQKNYQISKNAATKADDIGNRFDDQIAGTTNSDEVIDARRPFEADAFPTVGKRLDGQIGLNSDFRGFESDKSFMTRVYHEMNERAANVKWFGAVGDGKTDDTEAIQQAINTGNNVFIPSGNYLITQPIQLSMKNFHGAGVKQTTFDFSKSGCFNLDNGGRTIADVGFFGIKSTNHDAKDKFVFNAKEDANTRAVSYHFHDIEIGGGLFGGGFKLTDMFRLTVNKVGMTNVFNPFEIYGQVVQANLDDITCNIDDVETGNQNDFNTGVSVAGDDHSGTYQRPESVKLNNVNMVGYDTSYNIKDVMFLIANNCEADSCQEGIRISSTDGGVYFNNIWIAMQNRRDAKSFGINVRTSIPNKLKSLNFKNITITNSSELSSDSVAIQVGDFAENTWFRKGVSFKDTYIYTTSKLLYGVYSNRSKNLLLDNVAITSGSAQTDFELNQCEQYNITHCLGDKAVLTQSNGKGSTFVNNNIDTVIISGSYPDVYIDKDQVSLTDKRLRMATTSGSENNYKNGIYIDGVSLWSNNGELRYKFGSPSSSKDGDSLVKVFSANALPNPDSSYRGKICTLLGTEDKLYICMKSGSEYVWKQIE